MHGDNIAAISEEENGISQTQVLRFALEFLAQRSISGQHKFNFRHSGVDARSNPQKSGMVFVLRVHSRHHPDTQNAIMPRYYGRSGHKYFGGQGISNYYQLVAR